MNLPQPPSPLIEHANALYATGHTAQAMLAYERVLQEQPRHVHALHRMGLACFRENQPERARRYLDEALGVAPERADIWEHRGLLAALSDDRVAAEAFYHRALALADSTASVHRNLADCLKLSGRLVEARSHFSRALELDPTLHHAARALARIGEELEEWNVAADHWQQAWQLDSSNISDAQALLAALSKAGRHAQIDALLATLRTRYVADAAALERVAFALNGIDRFEDAISAAQQGIAVDPNNAWLHHNASFSYNMLGRFLPMHEHTLEAARLLPDNPRMQFNLAATQLRLGDFEEGWKQYRWHEALPENHDLVRPNFPEWHGEPLEGSRFLLIGEQGLGDQLQFLRMAAWLHRQGATVDVWVETPLGDLARGASGVHAAWTTLPPGPYDYWCRMMRLPEYMPLTQAMLPVAMPYLKAQAGKLERWSRRLDTITGDVPNARRKPRVGLVWAGNPAYGLDRYRSLPLQRLQPMLDLPGVNWFSLQMGAAQDELDGLPAHTDMHRLGPEIGSFADTLAIFESLDLVITVDTAVAHLAGAAGQPVWILLPTCTDWRWMLERTDSPWYPSARLFRQRELNQWGPVLEDLQDALREFVSRASA